MKNPKKIYQQYISKSTLGFTQFDTFNIITESFGHDGKKSTKIKKN